MQKIDESIKGIELDVELTERERSIIASAITQEWFDVFQKLMERQIRKFNIRLINTSASEREEILANHVMAKAAAQFYVGLMEQITKECEIQRSLETMAAHTEPVCDIDIDEFK